MNYKTIVLELIQSRAVLHAQLRQQGQLLAELERQAMVLKTLHQVWMSELQQTRPGSHPAQIRAEAMELALGELDLPAESDEPCDMDCTPPA